MTRCERIARSIGNGYAVSMWKWFVTDIEHDRPLLEALTVRLPAVSRGFLHQAVKKGRVSRGPQVLGAADRLAAGDLLSMQVSSRLAELAARGGILPDDILYESGDALVLNKPANLATHAAAGHADSLLDRARTYLEWRRVPFGIAPVHRLDAGTSGAVLFAKGRPAAGRLGGLMMTGHISKCYLALVVGSPPALGQLTTAVPEGPVLRPALTSFRRLAQQNGRCLLHLELVTGRKHQARRQLADAGWPIVGDRRYGGQPWPGLDHPFLHCAQLRFPDSHGHLRTVNSPLPRELSVLLASMGMTDEAGLPVPAEQ